jgi:hypothetical protein
LRGALVVLAAADRAAAAAAAARGGAGADAGAGAPAAGGSAIASASAEPAGRHRVADLHCVDLGAYLWAMGKGEPFRQTNRHRVHTLCY